MRKNLPVTQREVVLPVGALLLSVTDTKGRITYCNPSFVEASGYTEAELLGSPHNIMRHPDMPTEAFRDLWATVKAGLPWQGAVKNRCKDGSHYWVMANVTPVRSGEQIVGFLSAREPATREVVREAEALYQRIEQRSGLARWGLRNGQVRRTDPWGRASQFARDQVHRWGADGLLGLLATLGTGWAAQHLAFTLWAPTAVGLAAVAWLAAFKRREGALARLERDVQQIAAGDLSHRPQTGAPDRLGRVQLALAQIGVSLRTIITDVRSEVEHVRNASSEIAAGNQDLSARTEAQAASLQQTAASMEQINGAVHSTASLATEGARQAESTTEVAARSRQAVQETVAAMEGISDSSRRMGDIIQVIEGVAFQTNILALNAAVEAARAGEAGRGFAVVASEVRSLAHRTATAAKEIRELISAANDQVGRGVAQTEAAQASMQEAVTAVERVHGVLVEINSAAHEQESGVSQVNEAVSQMDGVTQQNAAMVEQLAASAKALNGQVGAVRRTMQLFRLHSSERTIAEQRVAAEAGATG